MTVQYNRGNHKVELQGNRESVEGCTLRPTKFHMLGMNKGESMPL